MSRPADHTPDEFDAAVRSGLPDSLDPPVTLDLPDPHGAPDDDPASVGASGEPARAPAAPRDWEAPPPPPPLVRWRRAGTALLLVVVAALAWWAVAWLRAPAPPAALPGAGTSAATAGNASSAPAEAVGDESGSGAGDGPSAAGAATGPSGATPRAAVAEDGAGAAGRLRVHVVGAVARPGVVELPARARVADAIAAAGGEGRGARTERINLAAPLTDGQQVLVPDAGTTDAELAAVGPGTGEADAPAPAAPQGVPAGGAGSRAAASAAGEARSGEAGPEGGRVDLNTADSAALQTLPGVGPATAEKIIGHREGVGPFTGLQDLDAVPGVGPATLERLRDRVTW